jgi:RND family efflux transporter MFP subunit
MKFYQQNLHCYQSNLKNKMKNFNKNLRNNFNLDIVSSSNESSSQLSSDSPARKIFYGNLRLILVCLICVFLLCGVNGCFRSASGKAAAEKKNEDDKDKKHDAPEVIIDSVLQNDVQLYLYSIGETSPYKSVDIRARVPGYLRKYFYSHGDVVNQDSRLAQIEPEQYQYTLEISKQDLIIAQQKEIQAKKNLDRDRELAKTDAKTQEELLQRETDYQTAVATVKRCQVAVQQAELNLEYTDIKAPITGKTTQHLVDENNFISPGTAEAKLLSITQLDPIYVDFFVSDKEFADLKERMGYNEKFNKIINKIQPDEINFQKTNSSENKNNTKSTKEEKNKENNETNEFYGFQGGTFEASLTSATAAVPSEFSLKGTLKAVIDNRIGSDTGQVTIRGELRNPLINNNNNGRDYLIYAGQICRVRIPYETVSNAVLIREEALQTDLDTKYVFVIQKGIHTPQPNPLIPKNKQNLEPYETELAFRRDVKIGRLLDNQQRIILHGLKPGEKYIVKGVQRARHGSPVNPTSIEEFNQRREKEENGNQTTTTTTNNNNSKTATGSVEVQPPTNNEKK